MLRPTFFRVLGIERVFYGFFRTGLQGTPQAATMWLDKLTRADVVDELKTQGRVGDALVLVAAEPDLKGLTPMEGCEFALVLGERVEFTELVDLYPFTVLQAGERGVVGARHPSGEVEIMMELYHSGLNGTRNCVWVMPFGYTDDLLSKLRRWSPEDAVPTQEPVRGVRPQDLAASLRELYVTQE